MPDSTAPYPLPSAELLFEGAPIGIAVLDLAGRLRRVNPALCALLGEDAEALVGRPCPAFLESGERAHRRADGDELWLAMTCAPIPDADGRPTAWVCRVGNATARRRAEQALEASEDRFRAAFANAPCGIALYDPSGVIVQANEAFALLLGYDAADLVGQTWTTFVDREDVPASIERLEALRGGADRIEPLIRRYRHHDGHIVWVESTASAVRGEQGVRYIVAQVQDVTARFEAERALRRSEEQFRIAFEQSQHGMIQVGLDGRLLRVNRRIAELFGAPEQELEGRLLMELVHPEERQVHRGTFGALMAGRLDALSTLRRYVRLDGSTLVGRIVAHVVRDGDQPAYVLAQLEDVTHERTALEERAVLEEQLRRAQRMEAVGRLAGGVAHDFNNMLSVVLNYADFARRRIEDPTTLQLLDGIKRAAERSAALTRQLMIFAGREVEAPSVIDLNHVVRDLLDLLGRTLGEDVEIETRLAPEPTWVLLAVPHAEQVFMNLAVNARDAMPEGGRLTIGTGFVLTPAPRVGPEAWSRPFLELTVADSGVGMTPEVLAHAFEPFFSTKGPGFGTGLGLSTVYGIVEQAGGHLEVDSAPGKGTTFKIRFPVSGPPTLSALDPESTEMPQGRGEHVLVVEDEDQVREITARILVEGGYTVTAASDGEAALTLCGEGHDLVLTDVVMPGLSGTELAQRLLQRGFAAPIVFMSGHAEGRLGSIPAKGNFLRKPFDAGELLRTVATALRHRGR